MTQKGRVSPFGDPRIKGCSPLPAAFRSVPRPSSPLSAKASTKCPYALDPKLLRRTQRAQPPARSPEPRLTLSTHVTRLAVKPRIPSPRPRAQKPRAPGPGNPQQRPVAFLSTMSKSRSRGSGIREQRMPLPNARPYLACPSVPENGGQRTENSHICSLSSDLCPPTLVEPTGIEPATPCLQSRRSPS
jgi:hypothetical protein